MTSIFSNEGVDLMTDIPMRKGYVRRWKRRDDPKGNRIDYWFCESAKDAAHWDTRESAQQDCDFFGLGIEIIVPPASTYFCQDFTVEEFAPDQFVIFCEAPFVTHEAQGQGVKG
ncbi:MAG: hypothetical protein WBS19_22940 [Candidatus Korobacteraceae bacterium]